jgi:hypothetical protein
MSLPGPQLPTRLSKRQRTWRAKRSVRVLGEDGIPTPEESHGMSVMSADDEDRARFFAFLEANAAEVATWPEWKQRAYRLVKDGAPEVPDATR